MGKKKEPQEIGKPEVKMELNELRIQDFIINITTP